MREGGAWSVRLYHKPYIRWIWLGALIMGFGGAVGVLCGGLIADRLARHDKRWYVWLPALAGLIALPFIVAVYMVDGRYTALMCMIIPAVMSNVYLGNAIANHKISPVDVFEGGDMDDPRVVNMARLFQSLDADGDLSGNIVVNLASDLLLAAGNGPFRNRPTRHGSDNDADALRLQR